MFLRNHWAARLCRQIYNTLFNISKVRAISHFRLFNKSRVRTSRAFGCSLKSGWECVCEYVYRSLPGYWNWLESILHLDVVVSASVWLFNILLQTDFYFSELPNTLFIIQFQFKRYFVLFYSFWLFDSTLTGYLLSQIPTPWLRKPFSQRCCVIGQPPPSSHSQPTSSPTTSIVDSTSTQDLSSLK